MQLLPNFVDLTFENPLTQSYILSMVLRFNIDGSLIAISFVSGVLNHNRCLVSTMAGNSQFGT